MHSAKVEGYEWAGINASPLNLPMRGRIIQFHRTSFDIMLCTTCIAGCGTRASTNQPVSNLFR
ncbi:hypothetical protein I7I50_12300 [Histoplasma capsulatum G186AR]|uniref:Uncharacterized protein n=1 Tax=Ajellomyces capsulatus TaxID=5037 RepID=A0A8H7Y8B5_AJECA|nr:hypothetical protein I7I52_11388 [Histoplasma capsulatum]QSS70611.1 hypothetical protein I7I50_12300 [Histoplasma capsulatum G186AR]